MLCLVFTLLILISMDSTSSIKYTLCSKGQYCYGSSHLLNGDYSNAQSCAEACWSADKNNKYFDLSFSGHSKGRCFCGLTCDTLYSDAATHTYALNDGFCPLNELNYYLHKLPSESRGPFSATPGNEYTLFIVLLFLVVLSVTIYVLYRYGTQGMVNYFRGFVDSTAPPILPKSPSKLSLTRNSSNLSLTRTNSRLSI